MLEHFEDDKSITRQGDLEGGGWSESVSAERGGRVSRHQIRRSLWMVRAGIRQGLAYEIRHRSASVENLADVKNLSDVRKFTGC